MSGFALYAFVTWLPLWRMGQISSADMLFKYFVIVMMLMFGVFMVSGGRSSFSVSRFGPAFVAGVITSLGFGSAGWPVFFAGLVGLGVSYVFFGE